MNEKEYIEKIVKDCTDHFNRHFKNNRDYANYYRGILFGRLESYFEMLEYIESDFDDGAYPTFRSMCAAKIKYGRERSQAVNGAYEALMEEDNV